MAAGKLEVSVLRIHWEGSSTAGKRKVYAVVICGSEVIKCKSTELVGGLAAVQQTVQFVKRAEDEQLTVQVFEKHRFAADKPLGSAQVQLWTVIREHMQQTSAPLIYPTDRKKVGSVDVRLAFTPVHKPSNPASGPATPKLSNATAAAAASSASLAAGARYGSAGSSSSSSASSAAGSSSYGVGGYYAAPGARPPPFPANYTPTQYSPSQYVDPAPAQHTHTPHYPAMVSPGLPAPAPVIGYPAAGAQPYPCAGAGSSFNPGAGWEVAGVPAVTQQQGGSYSSAPRGMQGTDQPQLEQQHSQQWQGRQWQGLPDGSQQLYQPYQQQQGFAPYNEAWQPGPYMRQQQPVMAGGPGSSMAVVYDESGRTGAGTRGPFGGQGAAAGLGIGGALLAGAAAGLMLDAIF